MILRTAFHSPILIDPIACSTGEIETHESGSNTDRYPVTYGRQFSFQMVYRPALSGMILGNGVSVNVSIASDILLDMSPAIRRSLRIMWMAPGPWYVRVWLAFRNLLVKIRRGSRCCGRPGQPGC